VFLLLWFFSWYRGQIITALPTKHNGGPVLLCIYIVILINSKKGKQGVYNVNIVVHMNNVYSSLVFLTAWYHSAQREQFYSDVMLSATIKNANIFVQF
jgi:hypothetical protein